MEKLALVTVLYKSDEVLEDFIASLSVQQFKAYHLYFIDNAPLPATRSRLQQLCNTYSIPKYSYIPNDNNIGVAAANNQGITRSLARGASHTLLLNNDIVFNDPNLLKSMYEYAIRTGEQLIIPKIRYHNSNKIWMAGGLLHEKRALTEHIGDLEEDQGQYNQAKHVNYAPTCFMLINNDVFTKIGLMREHYFVYYDDTDFIYRALQSGFKIYYMPQLQIAHKISVSTGGIQSTFSIYYMNRNRILFIKYNYRGLPRLRAILLSLIDGLRIARKCFNRQQWLAFLKGVLHGFQNK